jgi:pyrroline-5-carboxylate reductase
MTPFPGQAWFVGCGNMAGAMVSGWRRSGVDLSEALAIRPSGTPVEGVTTVAAIPETGEPASVLLGFKPQKLDEIVPALEPRVGPATLVVSILAGVELASLRARFPRARSVLRAMPNLPVSEGMGVVALFGEGGSARELASAFAPLGLVVEARDEVEFGAVGALAGAGPAYVARFIEALAKAGVERGLEPEAAARIALKTVHGTASMAAARGEDMAALAKRVASPKGTTEAGLAELDAEGALDRLIARTLEAAARRSAELAAAARS